MNPPPHLALRHDDRAGIGKHAVPPNVIQVIMGVDDEPHGQRGPRANLGEQPGGGGSVLERVDDRHAIIADHESRVRPGWFAGLGVESPPRRLVRPASA